MVDLKPDINLLYKRLTESLKSDSDDEVLRLSDQILLLTPSDFEICLCKALSLLRLNKYELAISYIKTLKSSDPICLYYTAYCHYKLSQYPKCLDIITKSQAQSIHHPGFQLLEAQIYYKLEKYEDSFKIYQNILEKTNINEENYEDILVNMLCSGYYAPHPSQEKVLGLAEGFLYKRKDFIREVLFNLGLIYSNLGQFDLTIKTLKRFEGMIEIENEGDIQVINDTLMTRLEIDYIESQIYGFSPEVYDEKIKFYMLYEKKENLDSWLKFLLLNNLIYFKTFSKSFHSTYSENLKTLDTLISSKLQKLNKTQEITLKMNKILLSLHKNKLVEAQKLLSEIETQYSKEELRKNMRYITSRFFLLYKGKNFKALEALFSEMLSIPDNKVLHATCHFIRAEINRLQHKFLESLKSLKELISENPESLQSEPFCLMVFSLACQAEGNLEGFTQLFTEIAFKTKNLEIQKQCAEVFLKKEQYVQAAQIYEKILSINPNAENSSIHYKLLQCYSVFDTSKAENLLHKIPLPDYISDEKELKKLLDKDTGFANLKQPGSPKSAKSSEIPIKKSIKKKKKKRMPKNFDPKNPGPLPDAERWLPMHERSKNKKWKGKKGARGAQGEVTGKESVNVFKSAASTANQEISSKKAVKSKKKRK